MPIKLYEHQLDALNRIRNGCILCGGVGTGKSLTSLSYYYLRNGGDPFSLNGMPYTKMPGTPKDLYIITTARKRDTFEWEQEMLPFLLGNGGAYDNKVVVDSWNNIKKYVDVENAFFIFDEQRVIGYGMWTKSFLRITRHNEWLLLSATPGDTWMDYIPVFIANGFYKNKTEFTREHVVWKPYSRFPQVDRYTNTTRLNRYRSLILVDMEFKRSTTRHSIDIWCEYKVDTWKWLLKARKNPWSGEPIVNAAELCYCMRRLVNEHPTRIQNAIDICAEKNKVIIFYNFDYELEALKNARWPEGCKTAEWNGHAHEPIPESDRWAYFVQYTAGAEGWNCTRTDTIIFYSQTYSYRTLEQSMGRIDRLNTPFTDLYYYHLKSKAPIDIAIARALSGKKKFNESRFVGNRFIDISKG